MEKRLTSARRAPTLCRFGNEAGGGSSEADRLTDQAYDIIWDILEAFEKCPNEAALPFLLQMLKHSRLSDHAVEALAAMPKPEFAETFRRFLFEEDVYPMARVNAAKGLARLGDEKTYAVIHQALVHYEKAGEDKGFLTLLSEAYDELTRVLQSRHPDFKPPMLVEQDKQHIRELRDWPPSKRK